MGRWLAVDHGTVRIGLAVSDESGAIASPLEVIAARAPEALAEKLRDVAAEFGEVSVVVGWPLNMDDTEGPQGVKAREYAGALAEAGFDVRLWDERLTSVEADAKLAGLYTRKKKKARQDALAAAGLLQDFLDADGPSFAPTPDQARPNRRP